MRLLSLVLALAIIGSLLVYYKDSMFGPMRDSDKTVVEQTREITDTAKESAKKLQQSLDAQAKKLEQQNQ